MFRIVRLQQSPLYPRSPFNNKDNFIDYRYNYEPQPNDIILYGGGTDVYPSYYGESLGRYTMAPDIWRDREEKDLFLRCKDKVAGFVGVCRGAQLLTVLNGGKLVQHVGGHCGDKHYYHKILTDNGDFVQVTSTHHQMMNPFDLPDEDYTLVAVANTRRSSVYLNGDNLSVKMPAEPEVVWFPKTKSLCIQGHPEYVGRNHEFFKYCQQLFQRFFVKTSQQENT